MTNPLRDRIAAIIRATGPMNVAQFMSMALFDPEQGYYTTRDPFGREGDFITAPEVSQMFGELVAAWLYSAWVEHGRPLPAALVEIGPGRGTMMQDMLRTLGRLDAPFLRDAGVVMVEASERLQERQREALRQAPKTPRWTTSLSEVTSQPLYIAANELFDALPVRQYIKTEQGWRERMITLDDGGRLIFAAGLGAPDAMLLPPGSADAPTGSIVELSPVRAAMMDEIANRLAGDGGAAILIDYGYTQPGCGDTLQAMRGHAHVDVLDRPGESDLTTHVDFSVLAAIAQSHGLHVEIVDQGEFLLHMGLLERAGRLGRDGDAALRERLSTEVERLAGPDQMGRLFKVLLARSPMRQGSSGETAGKH